MTRCKQPKEGENVTNEKTVAPHARDRVGVPEEIIERRIYLIRRQKVMLDSDLAELYLVETKALNRAVKRNRERFPKDFMFRLTPAEVNALRCQFGTSKGQRGGRRYLPCAFTEQGVAMLSSALSSPRAIQVNIVIMRAFVKLRGVMASHEELGRRIDDLEKRCDVKFRSVFDAIRQLMTPPVPPKRRIGFAPPAVPAKMKSRV
jgi:hypothetical protein